MSSGYACISHGISCSCSHCRIIGVVAGGKPYGVPGGRGRSGALLRPLLGVAFVVSLAVHELAHAVVARRVGLRVRGVRLSMLGGAAEIGADFRAPANECAIALAGLGVSAFLGIVAGATAPCCSWSATGRSFAICVGIAAINGVLVGLNVLPGFPLDGGRILRAAAWYLSDDLIAGTQIAAAYAQFVSWAVLALGLVVLFYAPVFGVWLAIMGYYIGRTGRSGVRAAVVAGDEPHDSPGSDHRAGAAPCSGQRRLVTWWRFFCGIAGAGRVRWGGMA